MKPKKLYHFIHKKKSKKVKKTTYWKLKKDNLIKIDQTWENNIPEELPRNYTKEEMISAKKRLWKVLQEMKERSATQERYSKKYEFVVSSRQQKLFELRE